MSDSISPHPKFYPATNLAMLHIGGMLFEVIFTKPPFRALTCGIFGSSWQRINKHMNHEKSLSWFKAFLH